MRKIGVDHNSDSADIFSTTGDCSIAIRITYNKICIQCFSFDMLAVAIYRFSLGHLLESHCNRPIGGFQV